MARPIDPEKRPTILKAARGIFLEKGFANTRMSEIAECAGVAVGTLYLYFDSKDSIARALAESFYLRVEALVTPVLEQATTTDLAPGTFKQIAHQVFKIAIQEREALLLAPNVALPKEPPSHQSDARSQFLKKFATALAALMAAGRVRRYEDPIVLAELVVALTQPVIHTYISLSDHDRARYESIFTDFLESALNPFPRYEPPILRHSPITNAAAKILV